jgi:ketosteroid isomerase-like protein
MTKVIVHEDCGNSPKNLFVQKLITAIAKKDVKFMLRHISEDIRWNIVGGRVYQGKDEVARVLQQIEVDQLNLRHIATHGRTGVGDGTLKLKDGRSQAFCDVFDFTSAKGDMVKEITTYVINLE